MRVPAARRVPAELALALALVASVAGLAAPASVAAVNGEDLTALATTYKMTCAPSGADALCTLDIRIAAWRAVISPATGPLTKLVTDVLARTYDSDTQSLDWLSQMHALACGDPNGAGSFAAQLWTMTKDGSLGPTSVGGCTTTGSRVTPLTGGPPTYTMTSTIKPRPTPKPTARATPKPTPVPTPKATPKATPLPSLPFTGGSSPSPEPSSSATSAPPATAIPAPTATASDTAGPVAGPKASQPPGFAAAVLGITSVSTDPTAVGGSALFALLLLLFMGFAAELFNNTVENNYDVISGWFRHGRLGSLGRLYGWLADRARLGVLAFLALTALVSSFVDPNFGLDLRSFAEFLGFLVGLIVILASFKLPPMLAHRRKTGELGRLRPLPWALVIAALFVLVSRVGNLQPGYLYGIVLGAIFTRDVSAAEEGRETLYGSVWTLAAAVLGWVGLVSVGGLGLPADDPIAILASTAFAAILVSGMEATAFGLMPLRFMPGHAVYRYNRLAWAVLFGLSVFAFIHILIGPTSGYLSALTPAAFLAALGVFAAFGALSIATWLYFRVRQPAAALGPEASAD